MAETIRQIGRLIAVTFGVSSIAWAVKRWLWYTRLPRLADARVCGNCFMAAVGPPVEVALIGAVLIAVLTLRMRLNHGDALWRCCVVAALVLAFTPGMCFGQSSAGAPIKVTLCDLLKKAEFFNGKLVEIRAKSMQHAYYEGLRDDDCSALLPFGGDGSPPLNGLTGEYAFINSPEDLRHPGPLAWKPIRPPAPVELIENEGFYEYKKYRFQWAKKSDETTCLGCPAFDITMTVVGRFDYMERSLIAIRANRKAKPHWELAGFGHMHGSLARLCWQSISDVVAIPIDASVYEKGK